MISLGEFDKPEYTDERLFIDVLCVPQSNVDSGAVVRTTRSTYTGCWLVVFVDGNYLTRAWCALEIAVGMHAGCRLTVIGSCDMIKSKRFYDQIVATKESDADLIKVEILSIFETKEVFNEVVAGAMQVLFVNAQKSMHFARLGVPREERTEWKERLPSTNPKLLPRNKTEDWDVISGNLSSAILEATRRTLRVFLSSTLSDTVVEWRFFLQDVMPYLQACARNRGIDLEVSDMRFGNTDEENLSLELRLPELERCRKESAGLFCVLLTGDKYGPRPAPARIPQAELEGLLPLMSHEGSALVSEWYVLDENQLDSEKRPAPEFILKETEPITSQVRSQLEQTLRGAALVRGREEVHSALRDPKR